MKQRQKHIHVYNIWWKNNNAAVNIKNTYQCNTVLIIKKTMCSLNIYCVAYYVIRTLCTANDMGINRQTVVNRLRHSAKPLRARRPYVGQVLNHRHRNARIAWGRRHVRWTLAMWSFEGTFQ